MFRPLHFVAAAALIAASVPALAQQQTTVRIGYIPVTGSAQIFVAEGEGWFKQQGLKVEFTKFESGPNLIQAVASGTIDVYNAGFAPLLVARSRGQDVRVVAATVVEEMGVAAGPALAPFFEGKKVSEKAAALKAFREKNGRPAKLATQPLGSGPNTSIQYWLWEVIKADKADVELVELGIDATQRAILSGAVEGGSIREPALAISRKQNPAIQLIADGAEIFPNFPGVVTAVTGDFAAKHPDAVKKLIQSIVRATAFLEQNQQKSVPHVSKAFGEGLLADDVVLAALKSPQTRFVSDPNRITEAALKLQEYQVKIGVLKKAEPVDGLFALGLYKEATASN